MCVSGMKNIRMESETITRVAIDDLHLLQGHYDFKDDYKPPFDAKLVKLSRSANNPGKYFFAKGDGSFINWCLSADRKNLNIARQQGAQQKPTQGAPQRIQFDNLRNDLPKHNTRTVAPPSTTSGDQRVLDLLSVVLDQIGDIRSELEDFKVAAMQRLDVLEVTEQLASSQPLLDQPEGDPKLTLKLPCPRPQKMKRTKSEVNLLDLFEEDTESDRPTKKRKGPH